MDFKKIRLLSFDCYGTLVDWKKSVLDILGPLFGESGISFSREELFKAFLKADRSMTGSPYMPYREVLGDTLLRMADELRVSIPPASRYILSERFAEWVPFPDTVTSLKDLKRRYRLGIISNVDDDLFSITNAVLDVEFDFIVTAQQLRSYKPAKENFIRAGERFGLEKEQILHVAQSIHHDILPSNRLGWNNVWVNRYGEPGRTDPLEFPDLEVPDLQSLVRILRMETA